MASHLRGTWSARGPRACLVAQADGFGPKAYYRYLPSSEVRPASFRRLCPDGRGASSVCPHLQSGMAAEHDTVVLLADDPMIAAPCCAAGQPAAGTGNRIAGRRQSEGNEVPTVVRRRLGATRARALGGDGPAYKSHRVLARYFSVTLQIGLDENETRELVGTRNVNRHSCWY